jgi:hypothetical protein
LENPYILPVVVFELEELEFPLLPVPALPRDKACALPGCEFGGGTLDAEGPPLLLLLLNWGRVVLYFLPWKFQVW